MKPLYLGVLLMSLPLLIAGCQRATDQSMAKQYDIAGKVVAVDIAKKTVTLDHKDIPGLMRAMEMEFKVENSQLLEGIRAGDQVQGRLEVRSDDYIITSLKKR